MYRNVWQVKCGVPGCQNVHNSFGPWTSYPYQTPSPYRVIFQEGWTYQRGKCLTNHTHRIYSTTSLYCPEHSGPWEDYVKKVTEWDREKSQERKSFWEKWKTWWNPQPEDQPPPKPW